MRRLTNPLILVVLLAAVPGSAVADALKETWYLMRSRSNMQIGNYAAAIEAWEKYLELRPDDREALKGIAVAHERQGQTDKAIARFDAYLARYPDDHEVAFKQADYLTWSRYAYRKDDAVRYLRNGLAAHDDPAQRLKYARLLAADKYDLDESLRQYRRLLERAPNDESTRGEYRGILLWDDKFVPEAITEYERLVEHDPSFEHRRQLAALTSKEPPRLRDSARWYAQLIAEEPNDYALRHEYAKVLARIGDKEGARGQYAWLVEKQAAYPVLGEYAGVLASERQTRNEAIAVYTKMLARRPDDSSARLRRAALYLADRGTAEQALQDYQRVLASQPRNPTAHRGSAQAYAWLGEQDLALYHSRQAQAYGGGETRASALTRELSQGREPRLAVVLVLPHQTGDEFELRGLVLGAIFRGELSPFLTASAGVGSERYDGEDDDESGSWYRLGAQYRVDAKRRFELEFGNRALRRTGQSRHLTASFTDESDPRRSFTAGFRQYARGDSFLALVGDDDAGIGGATARELHVSYGFHNAPLNWSVRPAIGQVASSSERDNTFVRVDASLETPVQFDLPFETRIGYDAAIAAYDQDHSGFAASDAEPRSGGYFSPQLLIDQLPFVSTRHSLAHDSELETRIGLRIQYVDDHANTGDTSSGLAGRIAYQKKRSPTQYLIGSIEHDAIGDRYQRTLLRGEMVFIFR